MPAVKKTPLERALDNIASPDLKQHTLLMVIAVLQQAWQEAAIENGATDKSVAAEARVYGRSIKIAQAQLQNTGIPGAGPQIIRHIPRSQMPTTPTHEKE